MDDKIDWKEILEKLEPAFGYALEPVGLLFWRKRFRRLKEAAAKLMSLGIMSQNAWTIIQPSDGGRLLMIDAEKELIFLMHGEYRMFYQPDEVLEYDLKIDRRNAELVIVVRDNSHPVFQFWSRSSAAITAFRHARGLLVVLKSRNSVSSDSRR